MLREGFFLPLENRLKQQKTAVAPRSSFGLHSENG